MPLLYTIGYHTLGLTMRLGWRPKVEGLECVPSEGGAILAGNHLSVADEIFLGAVLPRPISFWAKAEYFRGTGIKGTLVAAVVRSLGAIEVNRDGGRAALTAFDAAIPVLRAGGLVGIFPEGTRSPDGRLHRFRTGVARLALQADVPVVPVGFAGTERVQPIGAKLPKLGHPVEIKFGKPMDFNGRASDSSGLRAITDEVMTEVQKLTGQEYTGRYAPRRSS